MLKALVHQALFFAMLMRDFSSRKPARCGRFARLKDPLSARQALSIQDVAEVKSEKTCAQGKIARKTA
ncbi:MAG: hypothetical protein RR283_10335 [Comamonas sp.]